MIYFVRDTIMNKTSNESVHFESLIHFDLDMLYRMIDIINDTLVSIRFSVNQSVHFEVLLVKLAEMIKTQPQTVQNVATASVANEPDNEMLLQRLEQLENELKTLKEQGIKTTKLVNNLRNQHVRFNDLKIRFYATNSVRQSKHKDDIKLLKNHWQEVIDHAKSNDKSL